MSVALVNASSQSIEFPDPAGFGGQTAFTVALTVKITTLADGRYMLSQWGNDLASEAFVLYISSSDEVAIITNDGAGSHFYGKKTTDLNVANGSTYRICAKLSPAADTAAIWVDGVSRTIATEFAANTAYTGMTDANRAVLVGRQAGVGSGLDAEYSEAAFWGEYVPDRVCEDYTSKRMSPLLYPTNLLFYAPLINTAHLRNVITGQAGTIPSGAADAAHPSVFYRHGRR
jgi:hypothetical protein